MLNRFLLGLLLALSSTITFAQSTLEWKATWSSTSTGYHLSKSAAAAELLSMLDASSAASAVVCAQGVRNGFRIYDHHVYLRDTNGNPTQFKRYLDSSPSSTCVVSTTLQGGYGISYASRVAACQPGLLVSQTWSIGWSATATPTGSEPLITPPSEYCDGTCVSIIDTVDAAGVDTAPSANGHYEMTADVTYAKTGQTCTAQTPQPPVPDPPPPATGGDGDGDGTGGGDPPVEPDPDLDPGDGPEDPKDSDGDGIPDSEEPGDGDSGGSTSSVTCTLTQQELGACTCSAEQQAEGSCNTGTTSGSCTRAQSIAGLCSCTTPTGEPSTCAGGSGGGDPTAPETSQPVCGGPGLPACTVQILETQAYDSAVPTGKMSEAAKTIENAIDNNSTFWNKVKSYIATGAAELTGWNWTFSLPTGCTPFNMLGYGMSIDVCQFQPIIHDIMGLVWALTTIAFLIRLFLWGID